MNDERMAELDLDALMRRVRESVARRRAAAGSPTNPADAPSAGPVPAPAAGQRTSIALPRLQESSGAIARKERYELSEFMVFHDEDLVRNAYLAILRRAPDGEGFAAHLDALRQGRRAKVEVLGRMRYSPEGRTHAVPVRGLALAFALRSARRVPVVGRLLGIVLYLVRLPELARNQERLEAAVFQRQLESSRLVNEAHRRVETGIVQALGLAQAVEDATRSALDILRADMATKDTVTALGRSVATLAEDKAGRGDVARVASSVDAIERRLATTGGDLASLRDALAALSDAAAMRADVDGIRADVASEMAELARRIAEVAARSVPRQELDTRLAELDRALEFKADGAALTYLAQQMVHDLESRPLRSDLDALAERTTGELRGLLQGIDEARGALATLSERMAGELRGHVQGIDEVRTALATLSEQKASAAELRNLIANVQEHERRLAALLDGAVRLTGMTSTGEAARLDHEVAHLFDAFYVAFEDRFRGTREDIKQRCAVYLPMVGEVHAGSTEAPVLDIGCGRGEWLELLKDNGLRGIGVDLNRVNISQCRERGLEVIECDALDHLRGLPEAACGAITAMHVIEHVPFRRLVALFDEAYRVLRPGGVAIFETPNPENLAVGACSFYYDPTHERPLPPGTTRFVAESRGFRDVAILPLHPVPEGQRVAAEGPATRELLERVLYGAQDYAIIARKPDR